MQLAKNQKVNLAKKAQAIVLHFGVNWGMAKGLLGRKIDVDLDAVAGCFNAQGQLVSHVYSNLLSGGQLNNGYLKHSGDDLSGDAESDNDDNEIISVNFADIPDNVESIVFSLISFNKFKFDNIPYSGVRVYSGAPNQPEEIKASFNMSNDETFKGKLSVIVGRLVRHGDMWEFEAIGETGSHRLPQDILTESAKYAK